VHQHPKVSRTVQREVMSLRPQSSGVGGVGLASSRPQRSTASRSARDTYHVGARPTPFVTGDWGWNASLVGQRVAVAGSLVGRAAGEWVEGKIDQFMPRKHQLQIKFSKESKLQPYRTAAEEDATKRVMFLPLSIAGEVAKRIPPTLADDRERTWQNLSAWFDSSRPISQLLPPLSETELALVKDARDPEAPREPDDLVCMWADNVPLTHSTFARLRDFTLGANPED
jgi:hypothetical protein